MVQELWCGRQVETRHGGTHRRHLDQLKTRERRVEGVDVKLEATTETSAVEDCGKAQVESQPQVHDNRDGQAQADTDIAPAPDAQDDGCSDRRR
ncbi:hypothetical protein V5799_011331 [Amblyomma americanum]|uniref:Uncharacterized protein n=1 Tax=Amblyomma americanum TaxID=6943 RepID=A0AAQ4EI73_AMBAM